MGAGFAARYHANLGTPWQRLQFATIDWMPTLLSFLLRLFLVAAGLLLAASLAVAFVLLLGLWGIRAAWAKLTGRPVAPFIIRIDPRAGFERMYRRAAQPGSPTPRADAIQPGRRRLGDVTDVEPRPPKPNQAR